METERPAWVAASGEVLYMQQLLFLVLFCYPVDFLKLSIEVY